MKMNLKLYAIALMAIAGVVSGLQADVKVDQQAPEFTLKDSKGVTHSLSDYKDKYVVLEWVNYDCPFVRKHYDSGNMQQLQKDYAGKVVWFSMNSSAKGNQGNSSVTEINEQIQKNRAVINAYLIDENGKVGRRYGAKTTPHMFVIDPKGTLIYAGAIDNNPSLSEAKATNYVRAALDASFAGESVGTKQTKSYGCSVKY